MPVPPAGLSTVWSVVSGPGNVTFGSATSSSTTANFAAAGVYVVKLTANDGMLSASDDLTITVSSAGSAGILSANGVAPAVNVNLSAEGVIDWAHWGLASGTSFNGKSGAPQKISDYTQIGSGTIQRYANNPNLFSWTSGTPTVSATNVDSGLWVVGVSNGYQITVPADTNLRTLKIYVGACFTRGQFEASLSDGSAPAYIDSSLVDPNTTKNRVYILNFRAASSGQTLTIKWTEVNSFNIWGNVTLQAATLF